MNSTKQAVIPKTVQAKKKRTALIQLSLFLRQMQIVTYNIVLQFTWSARTFVQSDHNMHVFNEVSIILVTTLINGIWYCQN